MYKIIRFTCLVFTLASSLEAQVVLPDFLVNDPAQNTAGVGRTAVAAAANGNFAVAWQDHNEYGVPIPAMPRVAVQMFSANVTPIGPLNLFNGESRAAIIYDQDYLSGDIDLEFLPAGHLLVAVEHVGLISTIGTWVPSYEVGIGAVSSTGQIIDLLPGTGVILWLNPLDLIDCGNLRLGMAPSGDFFATLNGPTYDTDFSAVLIQQFDANVNFVGPYFSPHPTDPGPNFDHVFPDIATNGNILMVVWQDGRQEPNFDITAQFYNTSGPVGGNQPVNFGDPPGTFNGWPSLSMNADGKSVVVWADTRQNPTGEIFGQIFNASGQLVGSNFQISAGEGVIYDRPEVAMRNDGSFMVVWTDSITGVPGIQAFRARARQFDASGNPTAPPFILPDQEIHSGLANIATDGIYYYCSWLDVRLNNVTPNVYAKVVGDITNSVEPVSGGRIPATYRLAQNYPNPFNPYTTIQFAVPHPVRVILKIFDISGKEIATLADAALQPGEYQYLFDGSDLASGVYFYRLEAAGHSGASMSKFTETRKFILLK